VTRGANAADILRRRAVALARAPVRSTSAAAAPELLEFTLSGERYALESRFVGDVQPLRNLTPLPCTPAFVLGLVNLRGRIVPVLDLKRFFELPQRGLTNLDRVILVQGNGLELGLLADSIVGIRAMQSDRLGPSLATLQGIRADYLQGVTAEGLIVLDLPRILSDPRIIVHDEIGA
jgi:purine-binding chemotaxis protein CheW